jgi:hypothetical protein
MVWALDTAIRRLAPQAAFADRTKSNIEETGF